MIKTVQLKPIFKHHDQIDNEKILKCKYDRFDCYLNQVSHKFKKFKYNIYVLNESALRI